MKKFSESLKHIVLQRPINCERLERRYRIRVKRLNVVTEELQQRITAIAAKVRRCRGWEDSYRQNRLFRNNQRQLYRELDQEK